MLVLGIRISSIWNPKSVQWLRGRKDWKNSLPKLQKTHFRIWFHVSSLGEFEQAKPVIEKLKRLNPAIEIILSFFSPSGYNAKYHYNLARVVYLPADLPGNAEFFIQSIKPDLAVFVKYDLWPGYLQALSNHEVPAVLISANWVPGKLSSWSFPLNESKLKNFKRIFFQRPEHYDYFLQKGFKNIIIAGDTRVDRSLSLPAEVTARLPEKIIHTGPFDLIAGSTWPKDEELIIYAISKLNLKAIIAPHDVSPDNIHRLTRKFTFPYQLLSQFDESSSNQNVIVVDSIGLLSVLYSAGSIAYVGGGFGKGIHNILEPAAHAKPVIFGPRYDKFPEAEDMINRQCAWSVTNKDEFISILTKLLEPGIAMNAGTKSYQYLKEKAGATDAVANYILELISHKTRV